jgi:hypothetical protein
MADLYRQFPDVHPNIILKTDVLRQGMRISEKAQKAFNQRDDILWRGFHLFSYDSNTPKVYKNKIPMGFHLSDGCPIQIRTNDGSPYLLDLIDEKFLLSENNEPIAEGLYFDPKPKWYDMTFADGVPVPAVVQGFSGEYMFITINRYCELWNKGGSVSSVISMQPLRPREKEKKTWSLDWSPTCSQRPSRSPSKWNPDIGSRSSSPGGRFWGPFGAKLN